MAQSSVNESRLELWGGTECTVNRVGDLVFDQLERTGHASRPSDLDLFAGLGLTAIRYPILWERVAPGRLEDANWVWPDERLNRLRELGIRPIVGLVHHGNGPSHTSLIDPNFPEKLAKYAGAVAARYPWVDAYTPINEPMTTARFCGLYGFWYPHGRDETTCIKILLTQCRATILAMKAIRAVNPAAQLIQNDDAGKIFSTPTLAYEAQFQNERRWLGFDLLCGRVDRHHPLWQWIRQGAEEHELQWFLDHASPPDILGFDHYLTSERFLDENLDRYPVDWRSGNKQQSYADVAAVDVRAEGIAGSRRLLGEMWDRYHIPIAVTEAHHSGSREEQMRWFQECWNAAESMRQTGADIRAVTVWALLGLYDWHVLCTKIVGFYEPGVFDLRSPQPRPTAIASLVRDLAAGKTPHHPVLSVPGWWRRPGRLIFGVSVSDSGYAKTVDHAASAWNHAKYGAVRPLLITDADTPLGKTFVSACERRGIAHHLLPAGDHNGASPEGLDTVIARLHPWAVINAAIPSQANDADGSSDGAEPAALAVACASHGTQLLSFSSHLVFDGWRGIPYVESDAVNPLSPQGKMCLEAEKVVSQALPEALIIRTGPLFGGLGINDFVAATVRTLREAHTVLASTTETVSLTYIPDLVDVSLDLLIDGEYGIWHLANPNGTTWFALAQRIARMMHVPVRRVRAERGLSSNGVMLQPAFTALTSERGIPMQPLDDALTRYVTALGVAEAAPVLVPSA